MTESRQPHPDDPAPDLIEATVDEARREAARLRKVRGTRWAATLFDRLCNYIDEHRATPTPSKPPRRRKKTEEEPDGEAT